VSRLLAGPSALRAGHHDGLITHRVAEQVNSGVLDRDRPQPEEGHVLRILLIGIGLVLLVSGATKLLSIVPNGGTWVAWLRALLELVSGLAMAVGAWRSDSASVARLFKRGKP
jgi:hypothetical protein